MHFTILYGNYCYIFIENFPQKFSPCRVKREQHVLWGVYQSLRALWAFNYFFLPGVGAPHQFTNDTTSRNMFFLFDLRGVTESQKCKTMFIRKHWKYIVIYYNKWELMKKIQKEHTHHIQKSCSNIRHKCSKLKTKKMSKIWPWIRMSNWTLCSSWKLCLTWAYAWVKHYAWIEHHA